MLALISVETSPVSKVVPLSLNDEAIGRGLRSGEPWAAAALYDRYAARVERLLRRTLGNERHTTVEDLLHEVFLQAIDSARSLRDEVALLAWLQTIAVRTAYRQMRRRRALAWLRFQSPEEVPDILGEDAPPEIREATRRLYRVLDQLPARERVVFVLRYFEEMTVEQVAQTTRVSLSTVKRRLRTAEERSEKLARRDPVLAPWVERGMAWNR